MRMFRVVVSIVIFTLVLAACAAPDDAAEESASSGAAPASEPAAGAASEAPSAAEGEPIRIGANIEQSGPASVQGQAYANALQLRAEQINDSGGILGRPVELVIEDNATDESETITITRRLAGDGVAAMIGPGTSPTTLAAMEVILETGIPAFSMGSASVIVEPVGDHPNVFKTPVGSRANVDKALEDMEAKGLTKIGIIAINNPYGDSGIGAWEAAQEEGDYEFELVGTERFEAADTDMTAQLSNLVDAGAETISVVAIPPGAPTVRRNAVENLGLDLPMYFDAGAGAELFIELAGDAADGALVTHPPTLIWDEVASDDPQAEALEEFGSAYTEEFGAMSGFAGYAWDALGILQAAMEAAGSDESDAVIEAIEGLGEYVGVTGVYELSADDHEGLDAEDLRLLTVEGGEWTTAESQ